jgi:hypothetical protein
MKKVSLVCTTYGRFYCIRRILAQYKAQTYSNKELIIFNTDTEHPKELFNEEENVIIVNKTIEYITELVKQYKDNHPDIYKTIGYAMIRCETLVDEAIQTSGNKKTPCSHHCEGGERQLVQNV